MSEHLIFGTDGIRGRAGDGWLAFDGASRVGYAAGRVLAAKGGQALLGNDGRRSATELEAALTSGLVAAGVEVKSAGLITTPGLAWLTREGSFALGLMVSASHNPATDNGIKVFAAGGDKPDDDVQSAIEDLLRSDFPAPERGPRPAIDAELEQAYLAHLVEGAGANLDLSGMTLALDCANGAGSRVGPRVFGRLGAVVQGVAVDPDGDNINDGCGSTHPERLQAEVRARSAKLGVALDGDGDRCILVDERGELVHGDGILTVLGRHGKECGRLPHDRLVATVMSNRGLHRALREVGVSVLEVGVGDRAVVEGLHREGLALGGEQSGHVILGAENAYIGDGLYTALAVVRVMQETGRPLSELAAPYQPVPQVLLNVRVRSKPDLSELGDVAVLVRAVEEELGVDGRVLLRYSGTEDLARVMVEGQDADHIRERAEAIASAVVAAIGA